MKQSIKVSIAGAVAVLLLAPATAVGVDANAVTTRYEAEASPAVCQGTIDSNHSGYSGSGFCNGDNAMDAFAQFTVTPEAAGAATLGVRFANGATSARPVNLVVNGATVETVSFEPTGAWSTWSTKTVTVSLNAGSNTIRLDPTATAGLPNIDYLDVSDGSEPPPGDGRLMEDLGRGVVAVRSGSDSVLVSWRLLGLDPDGIGFNVYRSASGGSWTKLNGSVLTRGTNYVDSTADLSRSNSYRVRPVVDGEEQEPSGAFTLGANHATEPVVRVPLRDGGRIQFAWVGDLDGDGEYDYVVDRHETEQRIEAYRSDGTFLWEVDMGPNSRDQNNIEGGSSTIDVGHNDGVTVHDFDSDGRAEVAVRVANGVRFGDGRTYNDLPDNTRQAMAILDGRTGAARATAPVPTDYLSDGPMYARLAACHLDGTTPSLVAFMKNRVGNGGFNLMVTAWDFNGSDVDLRWKWLRNGNHPDGHNSRCLDVDGDGGDEFAEIGFVLDGDGTLLYSLGSRGVVHGDRYHIADMDPSRPGLEGYGIQQDNPSGLREYYYDAATGEMIWEHYGGVADLARGMAGDIDPNHPGMEVWSFDGLYNAPSNRLTESNTSLRPWPHLGLWWDGDTLMELYNDGKIEKWDPANPTPTNQVPRLEATWGYGAVTGPRGQPALIADVHGDWREEVVMVDGDYDELIVFTTDRPSDTRLYTLAHNPAYRNDMTVKGYMQSHHVDYFLGAGMSRPPRPDITYAGR